MEPRAQLPEETPFAGCVSVGNGSIMLCRIVDSCAALVKAFRRRAARAGARRCAWRSREPVPHPDTIRAQTLRSEPDKEVAAGWRFGLNGRLIRRRLGGESERLS